MRLTDTHARDNSANAQWSERSIRTPTRAIRLRSRTSVHAPLTPALVCCGRWRLRGDCCPTLFLHSSTGNGDDRHHHRVNATATAYQPLFPWTERLCRWLISKARFMRWFLFREARLDMLQELANEPHAFARRWAIGNRVAIWRSRRRIESAPYGFAPRQWARLEDSRVLLSTYGVDRRSSKVRSWYAARARYRRRLKRYIEGAWHRRVTPRPVAHRRRLARHVARRRRVAAHRSPPDRPQPPGSAGARARSAS